MKKENTDKLNSDETYFRKINTISAVLAKKLDITCFDFLNQDKIEEKDINLILMSALEGFLCASFMRTFPKKDMEKDMKKYGYYIIDQVITIYKKYNKFINEGKSK